LIIYGVGSNDNVLTGSSGEAIAALSLAEALQGKRNLLLPVSDGGLTLKTTTICRLIKTFGVTSLCGGRRR
jgi:hypothetical protein